MNEAAERYSPEIAEAFQKTFTVRPATKKSEAVREMRVAYAPRAIVARTTAITIAAGTQAVPPSPCQSTSAITTDAPFPLARGGHLLPPAPQSAARSSPPAPRSADKKARPAAAS